MTFSDKFPVINLYDVVKLQPKDSLDVDKLNLDEETKEGTIKMDDIDIHANSDNTTKEVLIDPKV
jgi:hypothetical protein